MSIEYFPNWNISQSLEGSGAAPPPPEVETIIPPPLTELRLPLPREVLPLPLLVPLLLATADLLQSPPPADDRLLPPLSIQEETIQRIFREVTFSPQ